MLNELFAAPKGDLQTIDKIAGVPIFTSNELKRNYLMAMQKTGKTTPIYKTLERLVEKNTLVPVYSTDKALKSIARRQPVQIRNFAGMVTESKKVYIFVEADANIFSFTSNEDLATVTIHELIHYMASFHLRSFYNIFKGDLQEFYKFYFTTLLNCNNVQPKKLNALVEFINFQLETRALNIPNSILKKYYELLTLTFKDESSLDQYKFNDLVTELIVFVKILQKYVAAGSAQYLGKAAASYKHIVSPLYVAYKNVLGVDPMRAKNLCFQELWSTSEVIAIPAMVKTPKANVYKALSKL
jgi:hypothetical protein